MTLLKVFLQGSSSPPISRRNLHGTMEYANAFTMRASLSPPKDRPHSQQSALYAVAARGRQIWDYLKLVRSGSSRSRTNTTPDLLAVAASRTNASIQSPRASMQPKTAAQKSPPLLLNHQVLPQTTTKDPRKWQNT